MHQPMPTPCSTRSGTATRSRPASSTSTCTSSTRSPARRPSTGCGSPGRPVRRPDRTLATADHNVPTDGTPVAARIRDAAHPRPGRDARAQLRGVRHPALLARLRAPGHRPRDRAGAGPHAARHDDRLRRQPHRHARRVRRAGVRHRHERGRARAGHADARAAQAARRCAIRYEGELGPGVTAKDLILAHDRPDRRRRRRRPRRRVRRRGDRGALDGGPDDGLQHDDRGRRPRGHDRARRDDVRLGRGPATAAPRLRAASTLARRCAPTRARRSTREVVGRRRALSPMVTWGTNPGAGRAASTERGARAAAARASERALEYMGLEAGTPIAGHPARPRVHRLLHELADRRPARGGADGRGPQGGRRRARDGRARARSRCKAQAEAGGPRRDLPRRRLRLARRRLLDVPGDEPGHR